MFKSCLFFSFGDFEIDAFARELRPVQATKRDVPAMTNGKCSVKAMATRQADGSIRFVGWCPSSLAKLASIQ